jgi:hypothetical protein
LAESWRRYRLLAAARCLALVECGLFAFGSVKDPHPPVGTVQLKSLSSLDLAKPYRAAAGKAGDVRLMYGSALWKILRTCCVRSRQNVSPTPVGPDSRSVKYICERRGNAARKCVAGQASLLKARVYFASSPVAVFTDKTYAVGARNFGGDT